MTTLIVLSALAIVILILILLTAGNINIKMDAIFKGDNNNKNKTNINDSPEFHAGVNYAFSLIQICLYKMWSEQDILDFDSINDNIKNNLLVITKNQENLKTWHSKYMEYLSSKNSGENNV